MTIGGEEVVLACIGEVDGAKRRISSSKTDCLLQITSGRATDWSGATSRKIGCE